MTLKYVVIPMTILDSYPKINLKNCGSVTAQFVKDTNKLYDILGIHKRYHLRDGDIPIKVGLDSDASEEFIIPVRLLEGIDDGDVIEMPVMRVVIYLKATSDKGSDITFKKKLINMITPPEETTTKTGSEPDTTKGTVENKKVLHAWFIHNLKVQFELAQHVCDIPSTYRDEFIKIGEDEAEDFIRYIKQVCEDTCSTGIEDATSSVITNAFYDVISNIHRKIIRNRNKLDGATSTTRPDHSKTDGPTPNELVRALVLGYGIIHKSDGSFKDGVVYSLTNENSKCRILRAAVVAGAYMSGTCETEIDNDLTDGNWVIGHPIKK